MNKKSRQEFFMSGPIQVKDLIIRPVITRQVNYVYLGEGKEIVGVTFTLLWIFLLEQDEIYLASFGKKASLREIEDCYKAIGCSEG